MGEKKISELNLKRGVEVHCEDQQCQCMSGKGRVKSKTSKLERVIKSSKTRMLRALFAKTILNFTLIVMRSPENLEKVS